MYRPVKTRTEILNRVAALAHQIAADFKNKLVTVIWLYEGAWFFSSDLVRLAKFSGELRTGCMRVKSYQGTESTEPEIDGSWLTPQLIKNRNILLIDDIIETGKTLTKAVAYVESFKPAEIKTCVLLRKPTRLERPIEVDYIGFPIPDDFVVGYGLDFNGLHRHLRYITTIDEINRVDGLSKSKATKGRLRAK
jgi:hypoxanthine phosphoribosyltransferase